MYFRSKESLNRDLQRQGLVASEANTLDQKKEKV